MRFFCRIIRRLKFWNGWVKLFHTAKLIFNQPFYITIICKSIS